MKIANVELEQPYVLNKNINYFVIENKEKFYEYCMLILKQTEVKDEQGFVLSENNKELNFAKDVFVIDSLLNISFSDRKITNKLHQLTSAVVYDNFVEEFNDISIKINEFLHVISLDNDFETDYNDSFDVSSILKAVNYKLINNSEKLLETVLNYINVIISFFNPKLIVIYNLRSWLSNDDCLEFYKYIKYNQVKVLLLESREYEKLEDENYYIIDKDLCELTF